MHNATAKPPAPECAWFEIPRKTFIFCLNPDVLEWCRDPYPGHPHGCPNWGQKDTCPPKAPRIGKVLDLHKPMYFAVARFALQSWSERMKALHPGWSDRQARCLLYWQPRLRKALRDFVEEKRSAGQEVLYTPEAAGVNVLLALTLCSFPVEWQPTHYVCKVALVGYPIQEDKGGAEDVQ